ncbi:hypothetical protein ASPSYDRAFT_95295 [Aspergillus sydowii CBS 593.65]|uniref:Uncharacterized protein n=1 Tax=Aspergillus sydowii CBS 593.65 TaxID=1036612 RepID=A0A1L9T0W1_9EURO|nr:uncharacterized protein ASPSYDRAFT_95295 [Aspergillus sydowii CBS 593.65]OJJ52933.1 hypothetical protein ASPSYDRAFT_95295 [Aspergillus sydowii CBS 593.65]
MRFFSFIATTILAVTPAIMAQGQNPQGCLDKCYVYSADAKCPDSHSAVGRIGPGCFKCCESV